MLALAALFTSTCLGFFPQCSPHFSAPPSLPRFLPLLLPFLSLSRSAPFSSQQVAHTGVAVVGDMECTGSSCSSSNSPTANSPFMHASCLRLLHSSLSLVLASFLTALPTPLRPLHFPVFFPPSSLPLSVPTGPLPSQQVAHTGVAVVGGEAGRTPLGWDGMGECRDWVV
ncbi:unnamed protein product [Closterium sp. NIES-65]|nr:unnamed protein product [Closterium sp. NIES-65]